VHDPIKDNDDDIEDRFYEECEQVFDHIPRYRMKNLFGDFNTNVGSEDVLNQYLETESI